MVIAGPIRESISERFAGRVVDFQTSVIRLGSNQAPDNQHLTVRKKGGGVTNSSTHHAIGRSKRAAGGVEQNRSCEIRLVDVHRTPTGQKDLSIREKRRGVLSTRASHVACDREGAERRIIYGRGGWSRSSKRKAAGDQYGAIRQKR